MDRKRPRVVDKSIPQKKEFLARRVIDESEMQNFAVRLAKCLKPPFVVYLKGNLGAGKTTLTRYVLQGMGHEGVVKSPTYTLVEPYSLPGGLVFHFDLYRLADSEELEFMGVRDYFTEKSVCLIEWPERGTPLLPKADLEIEIDILSQGRNLSMQANSEAAQLCLAHLDR